MRANVILFWILSVFFLIMAGVYWTWTTIEYGQPEWAGSIAITLSAILAAFIAVGIGLISLVGWVYEYYRGNFAR